jgi:thiamine-monophosphate kinase
LSLGPGREFDRIRHILDRLGPAAAAGIGDDCALVPAGAGTLVVSVDLSVEDVHFRRDWLSFEEIGWRAAAAALSDLAAEGAEAVGLLASVAAPRASAEEDMLLLMSGVGAAVRDAGGLVLGGDLTAGERWVIDVVVLGRAERPVTRAGAQPGDGLWVSGHLGSARAALKAWQRGGAPSPEARAAFAHPEPRIRLGRALSRAGARAMIDLSDGLGGDAPHLSAASGARLEIDLDHLPVSAAAINAAAGAGIPAAQFAAVGGEDYELLAALPPTFAAVEAGEVTRETGVPLSRIGWVRAGAGVRFELDGQEVSLGGFDHFA